MTLHTHPRLISLARNTILSLVAAGGVAGCSSAKPSPCTGVSDSQARLACYDSATGRGGSAIPTLADSSIVNRAAPATVGNWLIEAKNNPITDEKEATAVIVSESQGRLGRTPALIVRCAKSAITVYISWSEYLSDNSDVTYRFDKNPPATSTWQESSDNTATFYPRNDRAFADSLAMFQTLVAQITPYREAPTIATFSLLGARAAIDSIFTTCAKPPNK